MYRKNYCTTLGSVGVDSSIRISKMLKLYMMGKALSGKLSCMVVRKLSKGEGKGEGEKELKQNKKKTAGGIYIEKLEFNINYINPGHTMPKVRKQA